MLRVRRQARVVDAGYRRMIFQILRYPQRIAALTRHAQIQRFHAAQGKIGIEWRSNRAECGFNEIKTGRQRFIISDHRAAN